MNLDNLPDRVSQRVKDRLTQRYNEALGKPLSEQVDKVYVINLDERTDRLSEVTSELGKLKIDFERFSAVNGKNLTDPKPGHEKSHTNSKSWNKNSLALVRTTINIIEDAKSKGYESILILEDDVEFRDTVQSLFNRAKSQLPNDWEMFFFGIFNKVKPRRYSSLLAKVNGGVCCHAYMIHSRVYDVYLDALKKEDKPIDVVTMEDIHPRGKTFSFLSNFAFQRESFSNISNEIAQHAYLRGAARP